MPASSSQNSSHWEPLRFLKSVHRSPKRRSLPSELLIVDWGVGAAGVMVCTTSAAGYQFRDGFVVHWNDSEQKSPAILAERLRQELDKRSIAINACLVAAPRRSVALKNLELPLTDQASVAEMVQIQSENLFPVVRSTLSIDFVQHELPEQAQAMVLVAALPESTRALIVDVLQQAHLTPLLLGVAELSLPLLKAENENAVSLDILLAGGKSDFLISQSQLPVISYTGQAPSEPSERIRHMCSTVQRLTTAARQRKQPLLLKVAQAHGDIQPGMLKDLQAAAGVNLSLGSSLPAEQVRAQALLAAYRNPERALDFMHPREPINVAHQRRRRGLTNAIAAALLLVLIAVPVRWRNQQLDRDLASALQAKQDLQQQVARVEPLKKTWQKLVAFERARIDSAAELTAIIEDLRSNEQMLVESLELSDVQATGSWFIRIKGRVASRDVWSSFSDDLLSKSDRYRLRPPMLTPNPSDAQYPLQFSIDIELKSKATAVTT